MNRKFSGEHIHGHGTIVIQSRTSRSSIRAAVDQKGRLVQGPDAPEPGVYQEPQSKTHLVGV